MRPSSLLEIDHKLLALDFDLACTYLLNEYDAKIREDSLKAIGIFTGNKFNDTPESNDDEW